MIRDALVFLKDHLNAHLTMMSGGTSAPPHPEKVTFPVADQQDSVALKRDAVSLLLINIEQENTLRAADPYARPTPEGAPRRVRPDVRLNLYVLFVAPTAGYEAGLNYLSLIIRHFHGHPIFNHQNAPELAESIDQLTMELVTLPLSDQNDLWNALRTPYRPSALYKVRMVVVRDEDALPVPAVAEKDLRISS